MPGRASSKTLPPLCRRQVATSIAGTPNLHATTNGNVRWMNPRERALALGLMAAGQSNLFKSWPAPGTTMMHSYAGTRRCMAKANFCNPGLCMCLR
jgi:hypothetical protein